MALTLAWVPPAPPVEPHLQRNSQVHWEGLTEHLVMRILRLESPAAAGGSVAIPVPAQ